MAQALSLAANPESRNTVHEVIWSGLRNSLKRSAFKVLVFLLDNGADVNEVNPGFLFSDEDLLAKPSLEALEILIAHGWDIDSRPRRIDGPLLWGVVRWHDLVEWCLDHGASVYLPGDTPPRDANGVGQVPRITLLEAAAERGSVATFKLLREKGAPFHQGVLHAAVEKAVYLAPRIIPSADESPDSTWYNERMAMIRYLVDEVGINVNAVWWKPGRCGSTALDCVAYHSNNGREMKELVWFLLDHGADINHASVNTHVSYRSPLEIAQDKSSKQFLEAVQEWQERQRNNST
ncbi:ankyrin repeat-containing domain protein [Trichoderma evansii]